MSQRALDWALNVLRTYGGKWTAQHLLALAHAADDAGVVTGDLAQLESDYGLRAGWLESGLFELEAEGLADISALRRPRAAETRNQVTIRLRLESAAPQ